MVVVPFALSLGGNFLLACAMAHEPAPALAAAAALAARLPAHELTLAHDDSAARFVERLAA